MPGLSPFEMWQGFLQGFGAGLFVGLPLGPTGAVCAQYVLNGKKRSALLGALGSALGLGLWCGVALGASTFLQLMLATSQFYLQAGAGIFLCALAVKILVSNPQSSPTVKQIPEGIGKDASAFGLTLFMMLGNPAVGILLMTLFSGPLSSAVSKGVPTILATSFGMFIATLAWFLVFVTLLDRMKARMSGSFKKRLSIVMALVLFLLGISTFIKLFQSA